MTLIEMLRANGSWEADAAANKLQSQADRIEKLEEENGVLFAANVRLNSRADLDCDHYRDRIKKLEATLVKVAGGYEIEWSKSSVINMLKVAEILSERIVIAQKALEGKDEA